MQRALVPRLGRRGVNSGSAGKALSFVVRTSNPSDRYTCPAGGGDGGGGGRLIGCCIAESGGQRQRRANSTRMLYLDADCCWFAVRWLLFATFRLRCCRPNWG